MKTITNNKFYSPVVLASFILKFITIDHSNCIQSNYSAGLVENQSTKLYS